MTVILTQYEVLELNRMIEYYAMHVNPVVLEKWKNILNPYNNLIKGEAEVILSDETLTGLLMVKETISIMDIPRYRYINNLINFVRKYRYNYYKKKGGNL